MNKFISILDKVAAIGKDIWKMVEPIANAVEPELAIAFPVIGPLWSFTEALVKNAEAAAAAAGAQKSGKQKSALVLASLLPWLEQNAASLGIKIPTSLQAQAFIDAVVLGLKAFGSL